MKKILSGLIVLVLYGCSVPYKELTRKDNTFYYKEKLFNGKSFSKYKNGQLKHKYNWKNGKSDGLFKEWYQNGQLSYKYNWKNGKLDGLSKRTIT